ncbi:hypothetical protein GCM10007276_01150 [Agaricicola taiwanensis]|uniref:DUF1674 domain-containing protein n=1 Tax=Agaricicola taiwanensis TaxID=591372 RepID=A0A8J2VEV6_9RHOB|nr:DUF1674 domain-containing protein [Agaricicola taiwanensis]GGE27730.1 hypothetical protein GCM10007276_01150 [Agaricicola taiwanensis]
MTYMLGEGDLYASDTMTETETPRPPRKVLTPEAERALAEAQARRADIDARERTAPPEYHGRGGKEPVRYGDWEVKGIASDF